MPSYIPMLYKYSRLVHIWYDGEKNFFYKFKIWFHLTVGLYFVIGIQLHCFHILTHLKESSSILISESIYAAVCGINIYYNYIITFLIEKRSLNLFEELQDFTKFGEPPIAKKHMGIVDILNILIWITDKIALYCTGYPVQVKYYLYSVEEGFLHYLHVGIAWYVITYLLEVGALSGAACFTAFELVIVRLEHLKEKIGEIFEVVAEKERKARLRNCIRYYIYIARLVDRINICYNKFLAPCQVAYSVIIGVCFLSILNNCEVKPIMNVVGWIMAIFLNCLCGERMIFKSVEIATALYDTKWYKGSPSIRKDIAFMMMRTQKPLYLRTGPYGIFSLLTFKSIMKGGYTYATMRNHSNS
ncbi:putative odorant receptor 65b [Onthophagus taurus]|uniref:putative odorant receptor 65b n=1 Tax=Onthophagus taurus TaxID=166361 RepID=UPI0039BE7C57